MLLGGLQHQGADQIIGDGLKMDFLGDHLGALRAQHIEPKGGFDVAEKQLNLPAAAEQFGQGGVGVSDLIQEGGQAKGVWPRNVEKLT